MNGSIQFEKIIQSINRSGLKVIGQINLPGQEPQCCAIPINLNDKVHALITRIYPTGLYAHQAEAIDEALKGKDICLSTSTASGKSLVFIAVACNMLMESPTKKVLALYPARALIQDQIMKWKVFGQNLGITIGLIDGSVLPISVRPDILKKSNVVLMTPDVAHAWLMSNLGTREIREFLMNLELIIMDEAHVYDGVFGTNMAYFLRRISGICKNFKLIVSTATLGKPDDFICQLTGRYPIVFSMSDDRSKIPPKNVFLTRSASGKSFESLVKIIDDLAHLENSRFIAFTDSRKMAEQLVAALNRGLSENEERDIECGDVADSNTTEPETAVNASYNTKVLPYRAGYETEDRKEIQLSLEHGNLAGIVSTSAMELGIDIGEIDIIVMLNMPPSIKAFWQRLGRAGRQREGICILIDNRGTLQDSGDLQDFIAKELEPNWLYLENKYIQYANALCAAIEINEIGKQYDLKVFDSVPLGFRNLLENELNPKEIVPPDLYPLKQRAQSGPHHEFPMRSGIEPDFKVHGGLGKNLGNLSHSQALREAYPGAVYYYMARPFRVCRLDYHKKEIYVQHERRITTRPISQTMVFPSFVGGIFNLLVSDYGFIVECEMQASERVSGFIEQRGKKKEEHLYGPGSTFSQTSLNRFFQTTGVCWAFYDTPTVSESLAELILEAFCSNFGIQDVLVQRESECPRFFLVSTVF